LNLLAGPAHETSTLSGPLDSLPLAALHEVNHLCLEMLAEMSGRSADAQVPISREVRALLSSSSADMRQRAARRFFLLTDLRFRDSHWWRRVLACAGEMKRPVTGRTFFPPRSATTLARSTLVLAWNMTNGNPPAAEVIFGMTREVVEMIGTAHLSDLDRVAEQQRRSIQPRWHDRPALWRSLLEAAQSGSATAMHSVDLHAMQLLSGDLLRDAPRKAP
jgi:hypothetical protein